MILVLNIILTLLPTILVIAFVIYCFLDIRKSRKMYKASGEKFDAELKVLVSKELEKGKARIETALAEQKERFEKARDEMQNRVNLLSFENVKLMEQNDAMREKLTNLGFKEPYI